MQSTQVDKEVKKGLLKYSPNVGSRERLLAWGNATASLLYETKCL